MADRATDLKQRIVRAAADLLSGGGLEAVSTRAVSAAAGVQPPAIYRQFVDMRRLLDAAAREVLADHVRQKSLRIPDPDPLEELRHGWDMHVSFGLANPDAYSLIYGAAAAALDGPEARDGFAMLETLVGRIAKAGRLRMSVPHAARLIHAGACGVTLSLISCPAADRDTSLSHTMRDMLLKAVVGKQSPEPAGRRAKVAARAVALRAVLADGEGALSAGELQLLGEWLDRLAGSGVHRQP